MSAFEQALTIAEKILDKADRFGAIDPDSDLAILARQLLRLAGRI
jgi:hypothetical protein